MSTEDANVPAVKEAYRQWHDTKGRRLDHWMALKTDEVKFRSLAEGAKSMEFTRCSTCKDDVTRYFSGLTDDWEMN